ARVARAVAGGPGAGRAADVIRRADVPAPAAVGDRAGAGLAAVAELVVVAVGEAAVAGAGAGAAGAGRAGDVVDRAGLVAAPAVRLIGEDGDLASVDLLVAVAVAVAGGAGSVADAARAARRHVIARADHAAAGVAGAAGPAVA